MYFDNLKHDDKVRLSLFKKQITDQNLDYLKECSDEELIKLLNSTVICNAVEHNCLRYTIFFHLLFIEQKEKKDKAIEGIRKFISLESSLSKVEKMIIKFGIIHGFSSTNYRTEMFRYIKNPISLRKQNDGRKFISSYKFKECFGFAYNIVKRAIKNDRVPKI